MTQAFNLAQLANAVDTSGKLNIATNSTGVLPVANGGTGTSTPNLVAGTNISITGTWPNQTITNTASGASGTVTSVATGNGLQGGTITTTGTLSLAAPGFNTVGSYVLSWIFNNASNVQGGTYAAGSGYLQVMIARLPIGDFGQNPVGDASTGLSGTWRWMAGYNQVSTYSMGIACRVS